MVRSADARHTPDRYDWHSCNRWKSQWELVIIAIDERGLHHMALSLPTDTACPRREMQEEQGAFMSYLVLDARSGLPVEAVRALPTNGLALNLG